MKREQIYNVGSKVLLLVVCALFAGQVTAQNVVFTGVVNNVQTNFTNITVTDGAVVINSVDITVSGNIVVENAGSFSSDPATSIDLGGDLDIQGGGTFIVNQSDMVLSGANQALSGVSVGTLSIPSAGVGVKTFSGDVTVETSLSLNRAEVAMQDNQLTINSSATSAVTNSSTFGSEGFISTGSAGEVRWSSSAGSTYFFPLGAPNGAKVYRPIEVTAQGTSGVIGARFNFAAFNETATTDDVCSVNAGFTHEVSQNGSATDATVTIYYLSTDGTFDGLAEWSTASANNWNGIGTYVSGSSGNYKTMTLTNHTAFSNGQFALSRLSPVGPAIGGEANVCLNEQGVQFRSSGTSTDTYEWRLPSFATLVGDATNDTISVNWGAIDSVMAVRTITAAGCTSLWSNDFAVSVLAGPTTSFDTTWTANMMDGITFNDASIDPVSWAWSFGDGDSSSVQNPHHEYGTPGTYTTSLTTSDIEGCTANFTMDIVVVEDLAIANVFTPNGDGINDVFRVQSTGMTSYKLSIYNRWGMVIFESERPEEAWTGRTFSGVEVPEGTYFYRLIVSSDSGSHDKSGHVTLYR